MQRVTRRAFLVGLGLGAVGTRLFGERARAAAPEASPPAQEQSDPLPRYQSNFEPRSERALAVSSLPPVSTLTVRARISTTYFTSLDHAEAQVSADGAFNIVNRATGANVVAGAPAGDVYAITNNGGYLRVRRLSDGSTLGQFTGPILVQPLDHARRVQVVSVFRGDPYGNPYFRGYLEIKQSDNSSVLVNIANVLEAGWVADPLEKYLYGVVPVEMPVDYGAEALKAQAVAARTYAASRYNGSYVDVDDSTSTQVYYGYNAEKPQGNQAVDATRGVVATYNGSLISALYSACCGGHTEHNENVYTRGAPAAYLRGVRCYHDGSYADLSNEAAAAAFWGSSPPPASHCDWSAGLYRWPNIYWSRSDLQAIIDRYLPDVPSEYRLQAYSRGALGTLHELQAVERGVAGKIRRLRIYNSFGVYWDVLSDYWIRYVLRSTIGSGIQFSSNLVFSHARDGSTLVSVTAKGGGWGHGVGLCQRGARGMASAGYSYAQILSHYYTGIALHGAALEAAPTPLRPVDGGLVLKTADVNFAWQSTATYHEVQVRNLAGAIVRQSGWIAGTTWTTAPLSEAGTYEWRVGAWYESGSTLYCAWQRFFAVDRVYRSHLPLAIRGS